MLRALLTALIAAVATMGFAYAHFDKPKEAEEKKTADGAQTSKGDAKKDHEKARHGSDHGKPERK